MFLKFRYRLGFETLCAEVADSISWRRFCRIPLDGKVPHPTTWIKLTSRCGSAAVDGLNEALWAKAAGQKLLRVSRLRADTTVVPANVSYPTDSGLLARAIRQIAATGRRIQAAGGATRTRGRDPSRAAGRRAHAIAAKLRSRAAQAQGEKQAVGARGTGGLAGPAERPQLAPAVEGVIKRAGKKPGTVTADRSYGEQSIEDDLHDLGVRHVVIPRKGKPGKARQAAERRPAFRRAVKWRTGSEGRISTLKRGYGWDRTRLDGTEGARTWTGYGILAHNLVKISALAP